MGDASGREGRARVQSDNHTDIDIFLNSQQGPAAFPKSIVTDLSIILRP